jgi:hypothetical protein
VYNYCACRAQSYVECAFGILSNKWGIFRLLNISPDFAVVIVKACILYNFVCERDALTVTGVEDVPDGHGQSIREGLTVNNFRNKAADYFLTDAGAAFWQFQKYE